MLFDIKKVLVCTDLSELSIDTLIQSEVLRTRIHCEIHVLYVCDVGLTFDFANEGVANESFYEIAVKDIFKKFELKLKSHIERAGLQAKYFILEGHPVKTINDFIINGNNRYDLLILGKASHKGVWHHFLGSVARKIVSDAPIPVLVIKRDLKFNLISCFLETSRPIDWMVATGFDYLRLFNFKKIEFVSIKTDFPKIFHDEMPIPDFSQLLDDEIKYVIKENEEYRLRIDLLTELPVAHQLSKIIDEDKIDLAIVKRNRGKKLNKKFLGSETQKLLDLDTCNILVMPL
jgi:nucleotide-binding universal stress UspA family protein